MIKVFIVDDDFYTANALSRNLEDKDGIKVTGVFYNVPELLEKLKRNVVDIILMDVNMPGIDGIEASKQIKSKFPEIKIIFITLFKEKSKIMEAVKLNSDGFLYKGHTSSEIVDAIKNVSDGLSTYESSINEMLSENLNYKKSTVDYELELSKITQREKEIVKLLIEGKKDNEIARELFISEGYLRNSLLDIRRKLGLSNSKELAVWGAKVGL